jgi:acetoacetate decarboxylase
MKETDIFTLASVPIASPSYPKGPYRFIDREFMIITYKSDADAIRDALPEPLEPDGSDTVLYEFIKMPDSAGFGDYTESGVVIPALYKNEPVNFTAQMYLDDEPPISGGREIWGFPKKLGNPKLEVIHDTLTGRLYYPDVLVAVGTMSYKHENIMCDVNNHYICDPRAIEEKISKTQVNLKLIPDIYGSIAIAQLVAYNLIDISVKGAWSGPARLQLHAHVNAPVADLPVKKALHGLHFVADLTLPYGCILYDYKKTA